MAKAKSIPDPVQPRDDHIDDVVKMVSMRLHLPHGYRGRKSQEQYIPAGEYQWGDPALMGLETYLIENGHAIEVRD